MVCATNMKTETALFDLAIWNLFYTQQKTPVNNNNDLDEVAGMHG